MTPRKQKGGAFISPDQRKPSRMERELVKQNNNAAPLMTHKYRGSQQSWREVKPKFIDSTQEEPKNIYKP
jgi:hypothetical protein